MSETAPTTAEDSAANAAALAQQTEKLLHKVATFKIDSQPLRGRLHKKPVHINLDATAFVRRRSPSSPRDEHGARARVRCPAAAFIIF